ncbi:ABC transporter substrate-binding protein, partial [Caldivirga sp.]
MVKYTLVIRLMVIIVAILALSLIYVSYAQQKPEIINAAGTSIVYSPGIPVWNPFSPGNLISNAYTWSGLASLSIYTGNLWPILAKNWSIQVFPNGSGILIVYLRRGFYWFNGSATMPFTAWDVYAENYIGIKAFGWYSPFMQAQYANDEVRVLDNYTIEFYFPKWSPIEWMLVLTTPISTPWPVWKPIVEKLQSLTPSEATKYAVNITKFVAPYWALAPYYVSSISNSFIKYSLEPPNLLSKWLEVFPFADWYYYDSSSEMKLVGGTAQALATIIANEATWAWVFFSPKQLSEIPSSWGIIYVPDTGWGMSLNPNVYPFNLPQVRQALECYLVNRTATGAAWGLSMMPPEPEQIPSGLPVIDSYPQSIRSMFFNCTYNTSKAAELLESVGMYEKNGQWYLPNGSLLTVSVLGPSGWANVLYVGIVAANEWSAFGIPTEVTSDEVGLYLSMLNSGSYEAAVTFGSMIYGYLTIWNWLNNPWWAFGAFNPNGVYPFAWPNVTNGELTGWYCSPVAAPASLNLPNSTIVWCVNSTYGYINLTNLHSLLLASAPGSPGYEEAMKTFIAWWEYYLPTSVDNEQFIQVLYAKNVFDPGWIDKCLPPLARQSLVHVRGDPGMPLQWMNILTWVLLGDIAPSNEVPPLAEAIANGSLWSRTPQFAAFIGLPSPDPQLQACVASYFHIPYTPVSTTTTTTTTSTTTTTTSTSTTITTTTSTTTTTAVTTATTTVTTTAVSTVTSTATTTAVSTITVTKPVVSTA